MLHEVSMNSCFIDAIFEENNDSFDQVEMIGLNHSFPGEEMFRKKNFEKTNYYFVILGKLL